VIYGTDRRALRRVFLEAWRKRRRGLPLEPLEERVAAVVARHPEYHPLLEGDPEEALDRDWLPEGGQTNPFLHLAFHLALEEQLATGRPPAVAEARRALLLRGMDPHEAEHRMMDCLAEVLWRAQREGRPEPDPALYEALLRDIAGDPAG